MSPVALLLLACVACLVSGNGVDVSSYVSTSSFQCMIGQGFNFACMRISESGGAVDPNAVGTMQNAWAAGMSRVEGYIFPCFSCGNPAGQTQAAIQNLQQNNVQFGKIWFDIEAPDLWGNCAQNQAWLQTAVNQAVGMGVNVGIYSSASQWGPIMCGWTGMSQYDLWYAHYDNNPSFSDFVPFGGWNTPVEKQYAGDVSMCGAEVDLNFGGCQPSCWLRDCGNDGCGGSCGSCLWGYGCSPMQRCESEMRQLNALKNSASQDELVYVSAFWGLVHNVNTGGSWTGQQVLNTPDSQGTEVVTVKNTDGRLEAFYLWGDGVHHNWESYPGGPWSGDNVLPGFPGDEITAYTRSDGLVVVVTSFGGDIFYNYRNPGSDSWQTVQRMTGWALRLKIVENQDGRLEMFYPSVFYGLGHNVQTSANATTWQPEAALCSGCIGDIVSATLTRDGRINVIWTNPNDHYIYQAWQTTPGSTSYTGGFKLSAPAEFVHATTNVNGTLVVMFLFFNQPFVLYQDASFNWMPQVDLKTPTPMTSLVTTKDASGMLHAYGVGTDHVVYTASMVTNYDPSSWTSFTAVGGWACDYQCFGNSADAAEEDIPA